MVALIGDKKTMTKSKTELAKTVELKNEDMTLSIVIVPKERLFTLKGFDDDMDLEVVEAALEIIQEAIKECNNG